MTKTYCDLCGLETHEQGDTNNFDFGTRNFSLKKKDNNITACLHLSGIFTGDICYDCKEEFKKQLCEVLTVEEVKD